MQIKGKRKEAADVSFAFPLRPLAKMSGQYSLSFNGSFEAPRHVAARFLPKKKLPLLF